MKADDMLVLPSSIGRCPVCGVGEMYWHGTAWRCVSASTERCRYTVTVSEYKELKRDIARLRISRLPTKGTRRP